MQQQLWHDTIFDALGAAVQAAGGVKRVAHKLWPALDVESAAARLRGGLNRGHAQKLGLDEFIMIGQLAREAGDNSIMILLGRVLACEIKPISPKQAKKKAKRARGRALIGELMDLFGDDDEDDE